MKTKHLKKITLLHSNDLHGDFLAEQVDEAWIGGISRLSGYIRQVREEEQQVLYAISGDMFRGSEIDSEFKGLSTIEMMNMLGPDVAALGNHEVDYGIGHLLFLEKCANFPMINANLYLTANQKRLFRSHVILETGGAKILFIGILTEEVLAQARRDPLIGSLLEIHEAAEEVGKVCCSCYQEKVDLTVLLTHIGLEEDKKLAALLDPAWGVDVIIGGHTHTFMEEPCMINGIPIVQAVTGTDQIGRFEILLDTDSGSMESYTWQLIPIDADNCPRDQDMEKVLHRYQAATDEKYGRFITQFADTYTHPSRSRETELGKIFADLFRDSLGLDIMMLASGSLRLPEMGPRVDFGDLNRMFPFHDEIVKVTVSGRQLKQMMAHLYRPEMLEDDHSEFYQYSRGFRVVISRQEQQVKEVCFEEKVIEDDRLFQIGMQGYHFKNMEDFFGITEEEVQKNAPCRILAANSMDVLDENLSRMELVTCPEDHRWIMTE